jgi:glutaconyl-CoA/methylmalonyl-CoA decarboxylase subunit gamma
MPNYRVTVADRTYDVEVVDPQARPVRAIVAGQTFEVYVASDSGEPSAQRSVEQTVSTASTGESAPSVQPVRAVPVAASQRDNGGAVVAPLPGTIVSISVAQGEAVRHGQELCILEAMKMNNPIRATQAGVVKEILVGAGEQVQHGMPLMIIEASAETKEE